MARSNLLSPPNSPGAWLSFYRRFSRGLDSPLSPEQAAPMIGVSGATLRRWESNLSKPTPGDILAIGKAYGLNVMQVAFLHHCMQARLMQTPTTEVLVRQAERLLASEMPSILLDELFYPRAWNSLVGALGKEAFDCLIAGCHIIEALLQAPDSDLATSDAGKSDAIRVFWFMTAAVANCMSYSDLLLGLAGSLSFGDYWRSVALETSEPIEPSWLSRSIFNRPSEFKVQFRTVAMPAVYHLLSYTPTSDDSKKRVAQLRVQPIEISYASKLHFEIRPS